MKKRRGHPSPMRGKGRSYQWIVAHKDYTGEGCLTFPFNRDLHGYGTCGHNGKVHRAHRIMCELAHGKPPTPLHEAAHSCGNGHEGCIHPMHLSWKTHEENMADIGKHGRAYRDGRRKKLSDDQVREIRLLKGKMTYRQIAAMYGVNHRTIGLILIGRERQETPRAKINKHIPEERRKQMQSRARILRAQGLSYHAIADAIGCSRVTAKTYSRA